MPFHPVVRGKQDVVDVVIVGAGIAGLVAADSLVSSGKTAVVLEARDRVGGKVYDVPTHTGAMVETGAAFIGPGQDSMYSLASRFGVRLFPTYYSGKRVVFVDGKRSVVEPADMGKALLDDEALLGLGAASQSLDDMAKQLDIEAPWKHPEALIWDSTTLESWMRQRIQSETGRSIFTISIRSLFSAEPTELSLLQVLSYIARAVEIDQPGCLARLTSTAGGAQQNRADGGFQQIATGLAVCLGPQVVRLRSPVQAINKFENGLYEIHTASSKFHARSVIVALPPPLVTKIAFNPPLPPKHNQMCQRMPMGSLGKAIAVYDQPFWRDQGLSGQGFALDGTTVQLTFDCSPEDGRCGVLKGFLEADTMRSLDAMSVDDVIAMVEEDYAKFFGPRARDVKQWVIQKWDEEEFSWGGHFALSPPNVTMQYGATLAESVGSVFFASTERSSRWTGFMEGAAVSGKAAADLASSFIDSESSPADVTSSLVDVQSRGSQSRL